MESMARLIDTCEHCGEHSLISASPEAQLSRPHNRVVIAEGGLAD